MTQKTKAAKKGKKAQVKKTQRPVAQKPGAPDTAPGTPALPAPVGGLKGGI